MSQGVSDVLAEVASFGLRPTYLPSRRLDDDEWDQLLAGVAHHRLSGLLLGAVEAGALPAGAEQGRRATALHAAAVRITLLAERVLLDAAVALDAARIPLRVLKGAAHAHLLYADPTLRPFIDADVLVPPACFGDALSTLGRAGWSPVLPELRPGFRARFGKAATLRSEGRPEVDLHRTLAAGRFGLALPVDELFDGGMPFPLGGRTLLGLDPVARALHACYHAALGDPRPRLLSLRDVAECVQDVGLEPLRARARTWRGEAVLARAVLLTGRTLRLPGDELSAWADRHRAGLGERIALRSHGAERSSGAQLLAALPVLGARAKLDLAFALLVPERAYVEGVGGRLAWVRRVGAAMGRGVRG